MYNMFIGNTCYVNINKAMKSLTYWIPHPNPAGRVPEWRDLVAQHWLHGQCRLHPSDQQEAHWPLLSARWREQVSVHVLVCPQTWALSPVSQPPEPIPNPNIPRTSEFLRLIWPQILISHLQNACTIYRGNINTCNTDSETLPLRSLWERIVGPESKTWEWDWCILVESGPDAYSLRCLAPPCPQNAVKAGKDIYKVAHAWSPSCSYWNHSH